MLRFLIVSACLAASCGNAAAETVWFRGLGGLAFSRGIMAMAELYGEPSYCWCSRASVQADIIKRWKAKRIKGPVHIIGHSLGADAAQDLAIGLRAAGVPVGAVILLDLTRPRSLEGFEAYNFMSSDFRAREVQGATIIPNYHLRHVPLNEDAVVQGVITEILKHASR